MNCKSLSVRNELKWPISSLSVHDPLEGLDKTSPEWPSFTTRRESTKPCMVGLLPTSLSNRDLWKVDTFRDSFYTPSTFDDWAVTVQRISRKNITEEVKWCWRKVKLFWYKDWLPFPLIPWRIKSLRTWRIKSHTLSEFPL